MRRHLGKPRDLARARGLGSPAGALAVALVAALAALPTYGDVAPAPKAVLQLSEVMVDPGSEVSEAEGEWTEITVLAGGDAAGWKVTDLDGADDFVFPSMQVEAGEQIVVANGGTRPAQARDEARVLFAQKSWYTFDNRGDEAVLLAPDGTVADTLRWGTGEAVDTNSSAGGRTLSPDEPLIEGASLALVDDQLAMARPTPGAPNRQLQRADEAGLRIAGVVGTPGSLAAVVCPAAADGFDAFLWKLTWGRRSDALTTLPLAPLECFGAGGFPGEAYSTALEAALGVSVGAWASVDTRSWNASTRVALVDPWGEEALVFLPPLEPAASARTFSLWNPCACEGGWARRTLDAGPTGGALRPVEDLRILAAGPEFEAGVLATLEGAATTIEFNAYILTSTTTRAALSEAALRGVAVRVLLEASPVGGVSPESALSPTNLRAWNDSGVWARAFNTTPPNAARDHAKFVIADGHTAIVSTENFVGAAFSAKDANSGYAALVNSSAVAADLSAVFDWDFALGRDLTAPGPPAPMATPSGAPSPSGATRAAVLVSPRAGQDAWISLVDNATASVALEALSADLATLGPDAPLGSALLRACARGVGVRILLAGASSPEDDNLQVARALTIAAAARTCGDDFAFRSDARAPGGPSVLHAKVLVADGAQAILGSHNLVSAAFLSNREVSLWIVDTAAASQLGAFLEADFARGEGIGAAALSLDAPAEIGSARFPPTDAPISGNYALLAAAGTASSLFALRGVFRRSRQGRAPKARPTPPAEVEGGRDDPLLRLGPAVELAPAAEERDAFNPRAEPPEVAPSRPPAGGGALPPSALELFEKS